MVYSGAHLQHSTTPASVNVSLIPGRHYRHFKGGVYLLFALGRHSETGEKMVVYKGADDSWWVRPASMWEEEVDRDDYKGPRFTLIDPPIKMCER